MADYSHYLTCIRDHKDLAGRSHRPVISWSQEIDGKPGEKRKKKEGRAEQAKDIMS